MNAYQLRFVAALWCCAVVLAVSAARAGETDCSTAKFSRRVVVAGNAWGFAIGGLALGLGLVVTQRKKQDTNR